MTSENFIYWLNGFFEISNTTTLTTEQVDEIKKHIALVLKKEITPDRFVIPPNLDLVC